jgi:hypothetical protein
MCIHYRFLFLRAKYVGYLTEISIAFIVYVFRSLMRKRSLIEEFYAPFEIRTDRDLGICAIYVYTLSIFILTR